MRLRLFTNIVFMCVVTFALYGAASMCLAQSFRVPGNTGTRWIDTQLDLKPGTLIRLTAKGEVTIRAGESYGPQGTQKFAQEGGYPAETVYRYGLVARVTQSRTNPEDDLREQWAYGETQEHCAAAGGHLWLTVNDNDAGDNQGEFSVDVTFGSCRGESTSVSELHGRFRVTINGFTVNRQTSERNPDGAGDEVFVRADVFVIEGRPNGGFEIVSTSSVSSPVMGDTSGFAQRERAGTASQTGGLRTGDSYPGRTPWLRNVEPQKNRLPMVVWEGELRDSAAGMSVIVIPTIWEWDEFSLGEFGQAWNERLYPSMLDIFTRYGPGFRANNIGPGYRAFDLNSRFSDLPVANVPIGRSLRQAIEDTRVLDRVVYSFNMASLTLTFRSAREAARQRFQGAAGVTEIRYLEYHDQSERELVSYTLFAQVDSLN